MPEISPVRLEIREDRETIHEVRPEAAWPLPQTRWTDLHLREVGISPTSP